jgi:hypothetical protein
MCGVGYGEGISIEKIFKEEQKRLLNRLNRNIRIRTPIKIQIDEQHFRSQRNDSAATAVFTSKVDRIDKIIIHLSLTLLQTKPLNNKSNAKRTHAEIVDLIF